MKTIVTFVFSCILLLTINRNSIAQGVITWTGAISSDWHDPGNWDAAVVPDSTHSVLMLSGVNNFSVITTTAHLQSLKMAASIDLLVDTNAVLKINSIEQEAASIKGRLTNHGHIFVVAAERGIGPATSSGIIRNYGKLQVEALGEFAIHQKEIFNFHAGEIIIQATQGDGMIVDLELTNRGLIRIDTAMGSGLMTIGAGHVNRCAGQIIINNTAIGLNIIGDFSNQAEIIISDADKGVVQKSIAGSGQLGNGQEAFIFLNHIADTGLSVDLLTNLGYIDLHGLVGSTGIVVRSNQQLNSYNSGQLNVYGDFESSLSVSNNGEFYSSQFNHRNASADQLDWQYNRNEYNQVIDLALRNFLVHVPEIYDSTSAVPLLFMFHGSSGTGTKFYNISGWKELANTENFISVFPTGKKYFLPDENKCSTKWSSDGVVQQVLPGDSIQDDIPFVRELIRQCKNTFNIDTSRIYVCGFSNGGSFVRTRILDEMPLEVSALAASGGFGLRYLENISDSVYRPFFDLIGSLDDRALASTGVTSEFPYKADSLLAIAAVKDKLFNMTATLQVDTTYSENDHLPAYNILQFQADLSGQGNEYNFCMVPGLGHAFANGTNHPVKYVDILWPWFLQWTR